VLGNAREAALIGPPRAIETQHSEKFSFTPDAHTRSRLHLSRAANQVVDDSIRGLRRNSRAASARWGALGRNFLHAGSSVYRNRVPSAGSIAARSARPRISTTSRCRQHTPSRIDAALAPNPLHKAHASGHHYLVADRGRFHVRELASRGRINDWEGNRTQQQSPDRLRRKGEDPQPPPRAAASPDTQPQDQGKISQVVNWVNVLLQLLNGRNKSCMPGAKTTPRWTTRAPQAIRYFRRQTIALRIGCSWTTSNSS